MAKKKFYAVKKGREEGIYPTWEACKAQVEGYPGALYKGFTTREEALAYLGHQAPKEEPGLQEGQVTAYVDGSYDIKDGSYSYGMVLIFPDGSEEEDSQRFKDPEMASMRNVAGEIKGAMVAMDRALKTGAHTLFLHYDYEGIEHWALGTWKRNKEGTQAYKAYYDSIKDRLEVVFIKVPAHAGVEGNERADKLAKEAEF